MKKIIYLILTVSIVFSSCKRIDFGDINTNPNNPSSADQGTLMRSSFVIFSQLGGRAYYSNASLYAQYQSQTQYTQEQRYKQYNGYWGSYYRSTLKPLKLVSDQTTDPYGGNNGNYRAVAELFSVFVWKRMTDTFGDLPYTEALSGTDNLTPAYTPQRDIYLDLISRAKAARDLIDMSSGAYKVLSSDDIFYQGDMSKWAKFANSLIMDLTLQLSKKSGLATQMAAAFNEALNNSYGSIETNDGNLVFTPSPVSGIVNPISHSRPADFNITKELTDALKGGVPANSWGPGLGDFKNVTSNEHPDGRLAAYTSNGDDGLPYGYSSYGNLEGDDMNNFYDASGADFVLFNAAHSLLNRAEAVTVYSTGENAADLLKQGIEQSYLYNGLTVADADAYQALRVADAADAVKCPGGMLQVIGEEKWFALFPDGYAAWAEQRRTGYPNLHPAPDATNGGVLPYRMLYPTNAADSNPDGWEQGVQGLTPAEDFNTSKIWWEL